METLERIELLARAARREAAPATRVDGAAVLQSCRYAQTRGLRLFWPAAISALAAVVILGTGLTLQARSSPRGAADPVAQLFAPPQVELP
jgi:hypothetical protein